MEGIALASGSEQTNGRGMIRTSINALETFYAFHCVYCFRHRDVTGANLFTFAASLTGVLGHRWDNRSISEGDDSPEEANRAKALPPGFEQEPQAQGNNEQDEFAAQGIVCGQLDKTSGDDADWTPQTKKRIMENSDSHCSTEHQGYPVFGFKPRLAHDLLPGGAPFRPNPSFKGIRQERRDKSEGLGLRMGGRTKP